MASRAHWRNNTPDGKYKVPSSGPFINAVAIEGKCPGRKISGNCGAVLTTNGPDHARCSVTYNARHRDAHGLPGEDK